jgi:hypothetical protein
MRKRRDAVTLRDIEGKVKMLHVVRGKCGRQGRYRVNSLLERYGDESLPRVKEQIAGDCPRMQKVLRGNLSDLCGVKLLRNSPLPLEL